MKQWMEDRKRKKFHEAWARIGKNFMLCGLTGWGLEILLTSIEAFAAGDLRFFGRTSMYMFPIYGMGILLGPIGRWVDRWIGAAGISNMRDMIFRHGILDMVLIFLTEYVSGTILRSFGVCPWNYTGKMLSVDGLIRLDFAPFWFGTGLLFEYLTRPAGSAYGNILDRL